MGNPTTYRGSAVTWNGRRLKTYKKGDITYTNTYDANGLRTKKESPTATTKYYYAGDSLVYQCTTETVNNTTQKTELYFFYDSYGNLTLIKYYKNGNLIDFPVLTNSQGDVVAIYNTSGTKLISYEYDAWGNATISGSAAIGTLNPIRYRGYYYDNDLKLYYLQSRYYDAEIGRFISADSLLDQGDILGNNLFVYCLNNPVNMADPTGHVSQWINDLFNWVNDTIIEPIKNFFMPSSKSNGSTSLPPQGEPGSTQTLPNPDGTPKQKRWYGPDGKPVRDRDYNHGGKNIPFPHDHEWENGVRNKDHQPPSPEYNISFEHVAGLGLVTICTIGIGYVAANDITVVGAVDDFLIAPLGTGVAKGLIMVFAN